MGGHRKRENNALVCGCTYFIYSERRMRFLSTIGTMTELITSGPFTLSPVGAHLTSVDFDSGEVLFLSSESKFGEGNAIRGGVPLIAPWFATLLGKEPQHGWARTTEWEIMEGDKISAGLVRDGLELQLSLWRTELGFEMNLGLTNKSDKTESVQLAFHPYFRVADVEKITVTGADGNTILDRLTDETTTQDGPITFNGQYDRVVLGSPDMLINDGSRTIEVIGRGHDATVVWNPGAEKGASFEDLGDGEWRNFVCIEPALLGEDLKGVEVEPGDSISIGMEVKVTARN